MILLLSIFVLFSSINIKNDWIKMHLFYKYIMILLYDIMSCFLKKKNLN